MWKYDREFKEEAVNLSDEVGLKKAATQLGGGPLHAVGI
jgi:hypothetical protein